MSSSSAQLLSCRTKGVVLTGESEEHFVRLEGHAEALDGPNLSVTALPGNRPQGVPVIH